MYYYIFQSPKNNTEKKLHERIKNILTVLGISGENALVSPARTAEELAIMGVEKGYSTIVAVGSDDIVNIVASSIYQSDAILGVIPINASHDIHQLITTDDIKKSCEALQKRTLKSVNIGHVEPNINFLTKLVISSKKTLSIAAEIDDFYFETYADKIEIDNDLNVKLFNYAKKGFFNNLFGILSKKGNLEHFSFFNANILRLRTHEIIPVKIGEHTITKTPIVAYKKQKDLKIIKYSSRIK
jgi:hypothetical protein